MKTARDRVTKYGIAALAGIAILGWIREPEKHNFDSVPRVIFSPLQDDSDVVSSPSVDEKATRHESEKAVGPMHPIDQVVTATSKPAVATVRTREVPASIHVPATHPSSGVSTAEKVNHHPSADDHIESRDDGNTTASREQQSAQREQNLPGVNARQRTTERAEGTAQKSDPTLDHTGGQTPASGSKTRSTGRSAAIIAGIAAAGAAIGGAADGGKGAAIGAISGAAGGFVYDRMTRRKDLAYVPGAPSRRSGYGSVANDDAANDETLSVFRTPGINGR